ncbi:DUF5068 domain-containing protein [Oceanobacillus sp. FSL K6-2867]|uniref:DUF5068 domain-containing protein n=1 Tax=Oceanobacillus sp. FSL K6-2867 TaxID=2954748 RepID=UPI0030DC29E3
MKQKGLIAFITLLFLAIVLTACGNEDGENKDAASAEEPKEEATKKETEEETEKESEETGQEEQEENKEETAATNNEGSFSDLITYMEDETQGTASVLFENDKSQTHDMEGISLSLDAYTLVELLDFHRDFSIPFDDQNNGAVIIAQYTVKNDTDENVHYMPSLYMTYVGADKDLSNHRYLLPEEQQLPTLLSPNNEYLLEAGQEITGYFAYPIGEDRLKDVLKAGSVDVEVAKPQTDKDDFSTTFGSEGRFTLPLDAESADKVEQTASQGFYKDKATADNMGEKEMLESEESIGESKKLDKATVTLEGYQFTNFVPNADEAPRFQSEEVVLLTVRFTIDNEYDEDISKSSMSSNLYVNDGKQWTLNEGMLLPYSYGDAIPANESGELLQVYLLDQEQYEKIWKDKSFEMEIGPLRNMDAEDISKGARAEFKLK